jgi:hypothetical protein
MSRYIFTAYNGGIFKTQASLCYDMENGVLASGCGMRTGEPQPRVRVVYSGTLSVWTNGVSDADTTLDSVVTGFLTRFEELNEIIYPF